MRFGLRPNLKQQEPKAPAALWGIIDKNGW